MKAQVSRWGNSLGIRIPKDIAGKVGLTEGASVEIEAVDDRIEILPIKRRYRIEDLVSDMTPEAMREAFDWGPDVGREVIED